MDTHDWLAERFEEHRTHLRAVAYRILGSVSDADDAVQEAWLRLARSDSSQVENLGGWLTTVVARVSLNMLQSRRTRREDPAGSHLPEEIADSAESAGPEHQAVLADSIGLALLVVLDTLTPAERLAFVLHDMFAMPFEEIAPIVERSPAATRQLASRARRRVQGADTTPDADLTRRREIVQAFLAASRNGDLGALVAVLDPDVVVRADRAMVRTGAEREVRGVDAVAAMFLGRARAAKVALINGVTGAVWAVGGRPRVVFSFTLTDGKITAIDLLGDPGTLSQLDVVPLPA
ncbi:MAG: sigma-70 family RNA polymerase sigma factor [Actinobacteria bacterium]|nr:sigma-70 family RNA polymerase sigma factor [Actinomycetota bacterium]